MLETLFGSSMPTVSLPGVFTPGAVTMYMSREAIQQTVVRRFNEEMGWSCKDYEALKNKDIEDYAEANAIIDSLRICDPAVRC